jgi:hypothetical protein
MIFGHPACKADPALHAGVRRIHPPTEPGARASAHDCSSDQALSFVPLVYGRLAIAGTREPRFLSGVSF